MLQPQDKPGLIHPTAIVHPKAGLGNRVTVGPYCVIGEGVVLGDDCELGSHVTIEGNTIAGRGNKFYGHCSIGGDPQDKKYKGEPESRLVIGDNNLFREFSTVNRGSSHGGGLTRIGNGNWIMAYCHVAHDCTVGNDTVFANCVQVAGHCTIEDRVYLGGLTGVHQFCTIGTLAMTGGQSMIPQDVPPYVIASGNRARLFGVNKIGLERAGFTAEQIGEVQGAYKLFFRGRMPAQDALARIDRDYADSGAVKHFANFIRNTKRGILR